MYGGSPERSTTHAEAHARRHRAQRSADGPWGGVGAGKRPPDEVEELEAKVAQLKQAVASYAVVDQAIGVVVAVAGTTPDKAWDVLRETFMSTNIKLRHVAELIITWGATGVLASDIREELTRRLKGIL
ncbi:ANTAR domain-containing protein [Streptomyces sp. NPDC004589]|uniref:ANTAR domain-containing protein n=1 Tax=Streptomyces sp. NPDC004589 TaxID=3154553 RepID=UPI0033B18EF4